MNWDEIYNEGYFDPDHVFLISANGNYSYAMLFDRVRFYERHFKTIGLDSGVPLLIHGEKGLNLYALYLACLKNYIPFIPLGQSYPILRLHQIIEQSGAEVMICTGTGIVLDGISCYDSECRQLSVSARKPKRLSVDCAYLLFTSGSSGEPKAVMISRTNIAAFIDGFQSNIHGSVHFSCAGPQFDVHLFDFFLAIFRKSIIAIYSETSFIPSSVIDTLIRSKASVLNFTPSHLRLLLLKPEFNGKLLPQVKQVFVMGEIFKTALASELKLRFPEVEIYNAYGPTEATIIVSACRVDTILDNWLLETLPIAEAISSETLYLGDNGELVIKGNQVGMGYLGQQIQSGFEGENSFFTGDLANIHNGYFVVNGRNDRQIKLNAHRIDLSEIENLIAKFSDCMDCLVSLVEPQSDRPELVAFVCTQQVISEMDLRTKLNNHLPLAHIPKRFVFLKQFPLNINGKVDHLALINQSKFDQIDGFNSKGI